MMRALAHSVPGAGAVGALALAMPGTRNREWQAAAAQVQYKRAGKRLPRAISPKLMRILPGPNQSKRLCWLHGEHR